MTTLNHVDDNCQVSGLLVVRNGKIKMEETFCEQYPVMTALIAGPLMEVYFVLHRARGLIQSNPNRNNEDEILSDRTGGVFVICRV